MTLPPTFFPCCLIFLNLCASASYLFYGDYKRMIYWCAAATLTYCVSF